MLRIIAAIVLSTACLPYSSAANGAYDMDSTDVRELDAYHRHLLQTYPVTPVRTSGELWRAVFDQKPVIEIQQHLDVTVIVEKYQKLLPQLKEWAVLGVLPHTIKAIYVRSPDISVSQPCCCSYVLLGS